MSVCVCESVGEGVRRERQEGDEMGVGGYFTFRHTELAQDQICMHFILEGESEKMPRL